MKKIVLLSVMTFFVTMFTNGQIVPDNNNCIYCDSPALGEFSSNIGVNNTNSGNLSLTVGSLNEIGSMVDLITLIGDNNTALENSKGSYSVGLGTNNTINTDYSYLFGKDNVGGGQYGVAIGLGNEVSGIASVAIGSWCKTYKMYGLAIGMGCKADSMSTAVGFHAEALTNNSFAFGKYVKSDTTNAMTLGTGLSSNTYLENQYPHSFMIGTGSEVPSFFIEASPGQGKTGKIGIGNVTQPQAKLHIKGDGSENADIFLEQSGGYGKIYFGDMDHYIQGKTGYDFVFHTQADEDFSFLNGNVGIGTATPSAKLQVANGDIFIEDIDFGIIMKSPDGQCWKGQVDNSGTLNFTAVNCNLITENSKVKDNNNISVKVYPNPTKGNITVRAANNVSGLNIQLFDVSGFLVFSRETGNSKIKINTRHLSQGNYIIKVSNLEDELIYSGKISIMN